MSEYTHEIDLKIENKFDITILIPTFNEEENIIRMICAIEDTCKNNSIKPFILVVDDNSSDKTIPLVKDYINGRNDVSILIRYENHGLSQSLFEGFMSAKSGLVQCIDCDFSHPPDLIPKFYALLKNGTYDMVIGSRYIKGGGSVNWPLSRRILSYGAALIGRLIIPIIHDSGSGFFAINTRVLKNTELTPRGFRMGFEILGKGSWTNVIEIPFIFKNRYAGKSKLRPSIILFYLIQYFDILRYNILIHKNKNIKKAWKKFLFS